MINLFKNKKTGTRPSCKTTFWVSARIPTHAGRSVRSFARIGKINQKNGYNPCVINVVLHLKYSLKTHKSKIKLSTV